MKKRVLWLLVTGWMVAALLLASCAPAVVKEEAEKVAPPKEKEEVVVPKEVVTPKEEANLVKWTGKKRDGTVVEKMMEKPRYGGVHITARESQPTTFNRDLTRSFSVWNLGSVQEPLVTRDWLMGPAGTEEWSGQVSAHSSVRDRAGVLAESWEMPDDATIIYHIRKGVHFGLDPTSEASRLVGGRELTAEDVVLTNRRHMEIGFYSPERTMLADPKNLENSIYVSPTDKWTVVVKTKPKKAWVYLERSNTDLTMAREVIEKYGKENDWKNVVGTGAFILKEYVGASSLTYVRNPNYWAHDPFFPENQLPYLDGYKVLIIPDLSTRLAGLRTGKIDTLEDIVAEDAASFLKNNPELEWVKYLKGAINLPINWRVDTKPFDDVRVRRALTMAVNRREIVDDYYGGEAVLYTWPVPPIAGYDDLYIPLEEMPESVRELYEYNPDKAKKLLAEAGYPQGFKTEIIATLEKQIDMAQILKEYWAKIGVDLKIDVKDITTATAMRTRRTYTQIVYGALSTSGVQSWQAAYMYEEVTGLSPNYSMISDPYIDKQYQAVQEAMAVDPELARKLNNRESQIYRLEQANFLPLPEPYFYVFWQPWLKGYKGTFIALRTHVDRYTYYAWLDQELKKAMGR